MTALVPSVDLRRTVAGLVVMAMLAALLVMWSASPAGADTLTAVDAGNGELIDGTSPEDGTIEGLAAGSVIVDVDGTSSIAFCVDLSLPIVEDPLDEVTWEQASAAVPNLETVAAILNSYLPDTPGADPTGYELVGDADARAAAIQAAIWHVTDDFELTSGGDVATNYDTILAAVAAGALSPVDRTPPTVDVVPTNQAGVVGGVVGPFELQSSVASAEVTVSGGQLVTWPSGDPLSSPVAAGTQFGVVSDAEGTATITATSTRPVGPHRVFGSAPAQPLILAEPGTLSATTEATAAIAAFEGSITLEKQVGGTFNADGSPRPTEFTFDIEGPDGFSDTVTLPQGGSWTHTWNGLAAGDYTITERTAGDPESAPAGVPATVTLAPGGTASATVTAVNDYFEGAELSGTATGSCDELSASVSNAGDLPATVQVTVREGDGAEQTSDLVVGAGVADLDVALPQDATYVRISHEGTTIAEASRPTDCDDDVEGITTPRQETPVVDGDVDDDTGGTTLPRTGADPHHLAAAGVGLALLGAVMVLGARRPARLGTRGTA